MAQICQFDLEQSFLALQMAKGSNGDFTVASFMSYYWDTMSKQIGEDVELLRWQGDTESESAILSLCDGHLKKLCADADVVGQYDGAVTSSNVLATLEGVWAAAPSTIKFKKGDLRFYVSANVAQAYELAAASGNTQTYVTLPLEVSKQIVVDVKQLGISKEVIKFQDSTILGLDTLVKNKDKIIIDLRKKEENYIAIDKDRVEQGKNYQIQIDGLKKEVSKKNWKLKMGKFEKVIIGVAGLAAGILIK